MRFAESILRFGRSNYHFLALENGHFRQRCPLVVQVSATQGGGIGDVVALHCIQAKSFRCLCHEIGLATRGCFSLACGSFICIKADDPPNAKML